MWAMHILALETSTERGSCALWRDGAVVERQCPAGQSHSATLLPLVRDLLAEAGITFRQLDGIAFGAGPGAFTGLRVACGVAQGLAVAAELPVLPVVTLEAVAAAVSGETIVAVLDARMGEVYSAIYQRRNGRLALSGDLRVGPPQDVVLPSVSGWMAVGNALAAYPALAERVFAAGGQCLPDVVPDAAGIAALAAPRLLAGEGLDAALAAPLYVRNKVAQTIAERLESGGRA